MKWIEEALFVSADDAGKMQSIYLYLDTAEWDSFISSSHLFHFMVGATLIVSILNSPFLVLIHFFFVVSAFWDPASKSVLKLD